MLFDVYRGEHVVLDQTLRDDDGVLEVVATPRHEGNQQVASEGQLPALGGGPIGQHIANLDLVSFTNEGLVVHTGALVGATELVESEGVLLVGTLLLDDDLVTVDLHDLASDIGNDHVTRILSGPPLNTRPDQRGVGRQKRDGLALHVGAHQGTVGIVVFEERNQRGRHGDDLLRRHVHVVDVLRQHVFDFTTGSTNEDTLVFEGASVLERRVGLGYDIPLFLDGSQILDLVGDLVPLDLAVRGLDETEPVDSRIRSKRTDQADVRTLRWLDGTHASGVRGVHIANFEPGPLAGQTPRPKSRQTATVREPGQWVGLVHELAQLRGPEELLDGGRDWPDVDQALRCDGIRILCSHPFANDSLETGESNPELVLNQLPDCANPAVAEVVDVVGVDPNLVAGVSDQRLLAGVKGHEIFDGVDEVLVTQ